MNDTTIAFEKMNGIGNAILVADRRGGAPAVTAEAAVALATRQDLPYDQIMEIRDPSGREWDYDIRILNSDGSQAQACGNGMRCVVAWLNRETGGDHYMFRTARGILHGNAFRCRPFAQSVLFFVGEPERHRHAVMVSV